MKSIQTLPPLRLSYSWRVHGNVAVVVPSRTAYWAGIAFVLVSAAFPVVVAFLWGVEEWVFFAFIAIFVASIAVWLFERERMLSPPISIDLRREMVRAGTTTIPLNEIKEVRVVREQSSESSAEEPFDVFTIYATLKSDAHQPIAAFVWRRAAVAFGRKTAEVVGVPFIV